jgi:hypothetical protein
MAIAIVVLLLVNVILIALLIFCNKSRTDSAQVVMNFLLVSRVQKCRYYPDRVGIRHLPAAVCIRAVYAQVVDSSVPHRDDPAGRRALVGGRWDGKLLRGAQNNGAIVGRIDSYI